MKIKVVYQGFDPMIDVRIIDALKSAGFKWYASRSNLLTDERDICFDNGIYDKEAE